MADIVFTADLKGEQFVNAVKEIDQSLGKLGNEINDLHKKADQQGLAKLYAEVEKLIDASFDLVKLEGNAEALDTLGMKANELSEHIGDSSEAAKEYERRLEELRKGLLNLHGVQNKVAKSTREVTAETEKSARASKAAAVSVGKQTAAGGGAASAVATGAATGGILTSTAALNENTKAVNKNIVSSRKAAATTGGFARQNLFLGAQLRYAAAGIGLFSLTDHVRELAQNALETRNLGRTWNIASDELLSLQRAFERAGGTVRSYTESLGAQANFLEAVARNEKAAVLALEDLGLEYDRLIKLQPQELFIELGRAAESSELPTVRLQAILNKIFSTEQAARMQRLIGEHRDFGDTLFDNTSLTEEQIDTVADLGDAFRDLGYEIQDAMTKALVALEDTRAGLGNLLEDLRIGDFASHIGDTLGNIGDSFPGLKSLFAPPTASETPPPPGSVYGGVSGDTMFDLAEAYRHYDNQMLRAEISNTDQRQRDQGSNFANMLEILNDMRIEDIQHSNLLKSIALANEIAVLQGEAAEKASADAKIAREETIKEQEKLRREQERLAKEAEREARRIAREAERAERERQRELEKILREQERLAREQLRESQRAAAALERAEGMNVRNLANAIERGPQGEEFTRRREELDQRYIQDVGSEVKLLQDWPELGWYTREGDALWKSRFDTYDEYLALTPQQQRTLEDENIAERFESILREYNQAIEDLVYEFNIPENLVPLPEEAGARGSSRRPDINLVVNVSPEGSILSENQLQGIIIETIQRAIAGGILNPDPEPSR